MHLGIDLDNTLVCYDRPFHTAAISLLGAPDSLPVNKTNIKEFVVERFGNRTWTKLQAEVYGPLMSSAQPFPGASEFLSSLLHAGHTASIVSHKTREPAEGNPYDLHQCAREWLRQQAWMSPGGIFSQRSVHFFPTRREKVQAISNLGCDLFIDDLLEVFLESHYPRSVPGILFRTRVSSSLAHFVQSAESWDEISQRILTPCPH